MMKTILVFSVLLFTMGTARSEVLVDGLKSAGKGAGKLAKGGGKLAWKGTKKGVHGAATGTEKGANKLKDKTDGKRSDFPPAPAPETAPPPPPAPRA